MTTMQKEDVTLIAYCLDESGSMIAIQKAVIDATNAFFETQDPVKNTSLKQTKTFAGICLFNDVEYIRWVQHDSDTLFYPIAEFCPLTTDTYNPDGPTALFSAIVETIRRCDDYLKQNQNQNVHVIIVIQTDGEENASDVTLKEVKNLISARTEQGWTFTFLGANQDACMVAGNIGIPRGSALSFAATPKGSKQAATTLSNAVTRMRSADGTEHKIVY